MRYIPLLIILLLSCSGNHPTRAEHSYYLWKTSFPTVQKTHDIIRQENISHFYIHYFDVVWDNQREMPVPVAELSGFGNARYFTSGTFTPVVYISNECISRLSDAWCDSLSRKLHNRIRFIDNRIATAVGHGSVRSSEIQIDCDWTSSTRDKYFRLLARLRLLFPEKILSATIRMYPFKYHRDLGVPPVDKGLLMCYNLTNIKDAGNRNSIFSFDDMKLYLSGSKYPLPLDIALPAFGWYAWISRGNFRGIIYPNENVEIADDPNFIKQGNNYILRSDTAIGNNYLREGDIIRMEYPDKKDLVKAARTLRDKMPAVKRISFYHWDSTLINKYEDVIHQVYALF